MKPLRVILLSANDDTGSVGIRIRQAFQRHAPDWEVRAVRGSDNYARHDYDISGWHREQVKQLYLQADIIHWMERFSGIHMLGEEWVRANPRPAVLHHHGQILRDEREQLLPKAAEMKAVQLVSTIDLLPLVPNATWLPSPYNLEWLRAFRQPTAKSEPVVFHSPTVRARKGTDLLLAAISSMQAAGSRVELEIVEFRDQQYCLTRKGMSDIIWESPYGYGLNAIEGWGMGLPVMAGLVPSEFSSERTRQDLIEHIGYIPFYEFTLENLTERLGEMADNPSLRDEWADKGKAYVEKFHDDRLTVETLKGIYQQAMDAFHSA